MRLLVASSHFPPAWDWGGPVRSIWTLARGIAAAGHDVTVVTTDAAQRTIVDIPGRRLDQGVEIVTTGVVGRGRLAWANRFGLAPGLPVEIVRRVRRADLVHINGFWSVAPFAAAFACQLFGVPYVISTRGMLEERSLGAKRTRKRLVLGLGARRLVTGARALHFTTEMERDLSPGWVRRAEAVVVPNPIELRPTAGPGDTLRRFGVGGEAFVLGMFGRIHPRKGFDVILPALAALPRAARPHLLVVGPDEAGYRRRVGDMIVRLQLGDRVVFTGPLSGDDLDHAYASVDALVLPSHGESFGMVGVEAASQGTPCIVSDQVGLARWIRSRNIGLVVRQSVDAWTRAIGELHRERLRGRWPSDRLRSEVERAFSVQTISREMLTAYDGLLAGLPRRRRR